MDLGPNHQNWCEGEDFYYSGKGYNRVKVCQCGAEDFAPEKGSMRRILDPILKVFEEKEKE